MRPLYLASFDSRNFDFDGCGESEGEAIAVLIQGLRSHAKQYGLPPDWWHAEDMRAATAAGKPESLVEDPKRLTDDGLVRVRRLERGTAYRDREELRESGK